MIPRQAVSAAGFRRMAHTISTPSLVNLQQRWDSMSPDEQADLSTELAKRQEGPWTELTAEEKRAAYFVAFGPHGPRASSHPPGFGTKVAVGTLLGLGLSTGIFFAIRSMGNPPPRTMTREYQEATNERMIEEKIEPITGVSSEGYKGKGAVQSP
ncbi:Cytochrome c oxidase subunit 5B, mitochondrial [Savitreella phatthalungensis]